MKFRLLPVLVVLACGRAPEPSAPASTPHVREQDLGLVAIDAEQRTHLGVELGEVIAGATPRTRRVAGTVTIPPGRALVVVAAVAGTLREGDRPVVPGTHVERGDVLLRLVPIAPVDRDLRAQSRRQREASAARLAVAQSRLERTRKLVEQRGASQRALEEAQGELETATAEDAAARARVRMIDRAPLDADAVLPLVAPHAGIVRTISAGAGQSVAAGAPLVEVVAVGAPWIRVPVTPSELDELATDAAVQVARLGDRGRTQTLARPVAAPPSADPLGATVDVFFGLDADAPAFAPGERVEVELVHHDDADVRSVPVAAVIHDFDGGAWVYRCVDDDHVRRERVEVLRHRGDVAVIGRGPAVGTCIVTVGALELFGAELGVAH